MASASAGAFDVRSEVEPSPQNVTAANAAQQLVASYVRAGTVKLNMLCESLRRRLSRRIDEPLSEQAAIIETIFPAGDFRSPNLKAWLEAPEQSLHFTVTGEGILTVASLRGDSPLALAVSPPQHAPSPPKPSTSTTIPSPAARPQPVAAPQAAPSPGAAFPPAAFGPVLRFLATERTGGPIHAELEQLHACGELNDPLPIIHRAVRSAGEGGTDLDNLKNALQAALELPTSILRVKLMHYLRSFPRCFEVTCAGLRGRMHVKAIGGALAPVSSSLVPSAPVAPVPPPAGAPAPPPATQHVQAIMAQCLRQAGTTHAGPIYMNVLCNAIRKHPERAQILAAMPFNDIRPGSVYQWLEQPAQEAVFELSGGTGFAAKVGLRTPAPCNADPTNGMCAGGLPSTIAAEAEEEGEITESAGKPVSTSHGGLGVMVGGVPAWVTQRIFEKAFKQFGTVGLICFTSKVHPNGSSGSFGFVY